MTLRLAQHAAALDSDVETPISLFLNTVGPKPGILLESVEQDGKWGRYSIVAHDVLLYVESHKGLLRLNYADPFFAPLETLQGLRFDLGLAQLLDMLHIEADKSFMELPPITRALYGALSYEFAALGEARLDMVRDLAHASSRETGESLFVLPRTLFLFDHEYNRLTRISHSSPQGTALQTVPAPDAPQEALHLTGEPFAGETQDSFIAKVREAQKAMQASELLQLVLSVPFGAEAQGDLFATYRQLRRVNPSPYMFFMRSEAFSLAVSSPEVLISCGNKSLRLCPIAGTRPRGLNHNEDSLFEEDLLADPKEQAEHVMLVDLGRNDLSKIAASGTVRVERFMDVERFSHVMHLTSYLGATLREGLNAVDVLRAAFPAGTLTGAPKIPSMQHIARLENAPRGLYGGAIGWLGLDKDTVHLDFGITIRSVWQQGNRLGWQAGAGIVAESDPQAEWQECLNKSGVIRSVLANTPSHIKARS